MATALNYNLKGRETAIARLTSLAPMLPALTGLGAMSAPLRRRWRGAFARGLVSLDDPAPLAGGHCGCTRMWRRGVRGHAVATDVYTGLSEQRLPFSLSVAPDGETLSLDVAWRANCGGVVHTERRGVTRIADDGHFRWAGTHVVHDLSDGDEERQRLRVVGAATATAR